MSWGLNEPKKHGTRWNTNDSHGMLSPSIPYRIRMLMVYILTWLGFLLMVNGKPQKWHTYGSVMGMKWCRISRFHRIELTWKKLRLVRWIHANIFLESCTNPLDRQATQIFRICPWKHFEKTQLSWLKTQFLELNAGVYCEKPHTSFKHLVVFLLKDHQNPNFR